MTTDFLKFTVTLILFNFLRFISTFIQTEDVCILRTKRFLHILI